MRSATLIEGDIRKHLFDLTWPMIFGTFGLVMFNLVDTYFIGKLGVIQLAAMGFTFPVVTLINSFALGLGLGMSALVSRAMGKGNHHLAARITTDGMLLGVLLAGFVSIVGFFTIEGVFGMMGADAEVMPYIVEYMSIWYLGSVFVVVPMVGNNAIRATGDSKTPAVVMMIAGLSNAVLDYLLIFGIGVFPEMGMAGAALATVVSRVITFGVAIWVLYRREKLLLLVKLKKKILWKNWKELMEVGVPVALTRIMQPVSMGVLTSLLSSYGAVAVAGFGVATRIELFILMLMNSFVAILAPFAGQNYGARAYGRLRETLGYAMKFSTVNGFFLFILLFGFAGHLAQLFSDDLLVVEQAILYLRVISLSYIFYGVLQSVCSMLNVMGKPRQAAGLLMIQMFVIALPLALVLGKQFASLGIFVALGLSWLVAGFIGYGYLRRTLRILDEKTRRALDQRS